MQQKEQAFGTILFIASIALAIAFLVAYAYAAPIAIRYGIGIGALALFTLAWIFVRHALVRQERKFRLRP
ncbi:MAG: hypothetical protein ACREGR_01195 [Minisyncoccia bacterium]